MPSKISEQSLTRPWRVGITKMWPKPELDVQVPPPGDVLMAVDVFAIRLMSRHKCFLAVQRIFAPRGWLDWLGICSRYAWNDRRTPKEYPAKADVCLGVGHEKLEIPDLKGFINRTQTSWRGFVRMNNSVISIWIHFECVRSSNMHDPCIYA